MLSPSSLSRPCGSKELVQLRWLKAIWALGGHSPDHTQGPAPPAVLCGPSHSPASPVQGFSTISLPCHKGARKTSYFLGLSSSTRAFSPSEQVAIPPEVPAFLIFLISYQITLKRRDKRQGGKGNLTDTPVQAWAQGH